MNDLAKNSELTTGSSPDYALAPEGTHIAICFGLAHLGHIKKIYNNTESWVKQVMFGFELCNEKAVFNEDKGEEPFGIWTWPYTDSISTKANLNSFIGSWRNKKFTKEDIADGFDLSVVVEKACQLSIQHNKGKNNDNIYPNISAIIAPPKGVTIPPIHNKPFVFNVRKPSEEMEKLFFRLPKWVRKMVRGSKEYIENNLNWPEPDEGNSNDHSDPNDAFKSDKDDPKAKQSAQSGW